METTLIAFSKYTPPRSDSVVLQSVKNFIQDSGLVDGLDDNHIFKICATADCQVLEPGTVFCVQGRPSDCSYMLLEGKVGAFGCFESSAMRLLEDAEASNKMIQRLSGDALYNFLGTRLRTFTAPTDFLPGISSGRTRGYSCVASSTCILFAIPNNVYKECLEKSNASRNKSHSHKVALLRSLPICQGWSDSRLCQACNEMSPLTVEANTALAVQGEKISDLYLVDKGSVRLSERVLFNQSTCNIDRFSRRGPSAGEQEVKCEVTTLSRGCFVGDAEMVKAFKHWIFSSVAAVCSEVYTLSTEQFALFFMRNPDECSTLQTLQEMVERNLLFFNRKVENACYQAAINPLQSSKVQQETEQKTTINQLPVKSQCVSPKLMITPRQDSGGVMRASSRKMIETFSTEVQRSSESSKKPTIQSQKHDEDTMDREVIAELQKMKSLARPNPGTSFKAVPSLSKPNSQSLIFGKSFDCSTRGAANAAVSSLIQNIGPAAALDKAPVETPGLQPLPNGQVVGEEWMQSAAALLNGSLVQRGRPSKPIGFSLVPQTSRKENADSSLFAGGMTAHGQLTPQTARRQVRAQTSSNDLGGMTSRGKNSMFKVTTSAPDLSKSGQEPVPQTSRREKQGSLADNMNTRKISRQLSSVASNSSSQLLGVGLGQIPQTSRQEKNAAPVLSNGICMTARGYGQEQIPQTSRREKNAAPVLSNGICMTARGSGQEKVPQTSRKSQEMSVPSQSHDTVCVTARGIPRHPTLKERTPTLQALHQDAHALGSSPIILKKVKDTSRTVLDGQDTEQSTSFQDQVKQKILASRGSIVASTRTSSNCRSSISDDPMEEQSTDFQDPVKQKILSTRGSSVPFTRTQSSCRSSSIYEDPIEENTYAELLETNFQEPRSRPQIVMHLNITNTQSDTPAPSGIFKVEESKQKVTQTTKKIGSPKKAQENTCALPSFSKLSPKNTNTSKTNKVPNLNLKKEMDPRLEAPAPLFSLTIKLKGKHLDLHYHQDQPPLLAAQQFITDNNLQDDEQRDLYIDAVKGQIAARLKQLGKESVHEQANLCFPRQQRTARHKSVAEAPALATARAGSSPNFGISKLGEGFMQLKMQKGGIPGLRTARGGSVIYLSGLPADAYAMTQGGEK